MKRVVRVPFWMALTLMWASGRTGQRRIARLRLGNTERIFT